MSGAYSLRDEIIGRGETQSTVFMKLFERLAENWKKESVETKQDEKPNQPENVSSH